MSNGKQQQRTIAQQAVAIFMVGTLDEARSILEIGTAIVEQRALGAGPAAVAASNAPAPTRRRGPGRPRVGLPQAQATGPVLVPSLPDLTAIPPGTIPGVITPPRRRRRPPIVPTSNQPEQPIVPPASNELPPQGEPDVDEA